MTFPRDNCYFFCDLFYCGLISSHINYNLKLAGQNNETMTYSECFHTLSNCLLTKASWIWLPHIIRHTHSYTHRHTQTYTHSHARKHTHIHTHIHTYTHTHTHPHTLTHTQTNTHAYMRHACSIAHLVAFE